MRPYLTTGENIIPVFVKSKKPFDYENYDVDGLDALLNKDNSFSDTDLLEISAGSWKKIESPKVQERIKSLGFDGFYVKESFNKNLAVYEPNQVKSAFNVAPTESPDIRYALREFKMSDLPESGTYTLKAGTEIFHGAHKAKAEEIKTGGKNLSARPKDKSGGGMLYEGNLIWFGDKSLATGHSKSEIDVNKARYDAEAGIIRKPGEVFSTITDRNYKLISVFNYKFSKEQILKLLEIKWWDWSDTKIFKFTPILSSQNVDYFIKKALNSKS